MAYTAPAAGAYTTGAAPTYPAAAPTLISTYPAAAPTYPAAAPTSISTYPAAAPTYPAAAPTSISTYPAAAPTYPAAAPTYPAAAPTLISTYPAAAPTYPAAAPTSISTYPAAAPTSISTYPAAAPTYPAAAPTYPAALASISTYPAATTAVPTIVSFSDTIVIAPPPPALSGALRPWAEGLRTFLYNLLAPVILAEAERAKYVDIQRMSLTNGWLYAFTHESADEMRNYERAEHYGDALLEGLFTAVLIGLFPTHTVKGYTELFRSVMSVEVQSKLTTRFELDKHLRIIKTIDVSAAGSAVTELPLPTAIKGDLFEAFFGALKITADSVARGSGDFVCEQMLRYMLRGEKFDIKEAEGNVISQVKQLFTSMSTKFHTQEEKRYLPERKIYQITVSNRAGADYINAHFVHPKGPLGAFLGTGEGETLQEAKRVAYTKALEQLAGYGITPSAVALQKQQQQFGYGLREIGNKALEVARRSGFIHIYVKLLHKLSSENINVVQLRGSKEDSIGGEDELLASVITYGVEPKLEVLKKYLRQHNEAIPPQYLDARTTTR